MVAKFITDKDHAKLFIISDTHLIANQLHDNGSAFQRMRNTSAGKDLDYQEIALTAFTRKIIEDKSTALIITGDLTFNGELASAKKLRSIFSPLKAAGVHLFVVPGNHDIYDGWARKFENEKELYAQQISPFDWKAIFPDGYKNTDSAELFYSVNLNSQYHLIFLDSNIYSHQGLTPITNGRISSKQLQWLENDLEKAKKNNQRSLIFMHHNLYDHNQVIHGGYTLDNTSELQKLCTKYKVTAVFSGHIHAQNIVRGNSCSTPDIASSCFAMTDQGYGIVDLSPARFSYQRHSFNMTHYLTDKEKAELPTENFHQYLAGLFNFTNHTQMSWLYKAITDRDEQTAITQFIDELNWNFFIGKSNYSEKQKAQLKTNHAYQLIAQKLPEMKNYLDSLLAVNQDSWHLDIEF